MQSVTPTDKLYKEMSKNIGTKTIMLTWGKYWLENKQKTVVLENVQPVPSVVLRDKLQEDLSKTIRTKNMTLTMASNGIQNHKTYCERLQNLTYRRLTMLEAF